MGLFDKFMDVMRLSPDDDDDFYDDDYYEEEEEPVRKKSFRKEKKSSRNRFRIRSLQCAQSSVRTAVRCLYVS